MENTIRRPDLGARRTLNASTMHIPYQDSAAYLPGLRVEIDPAKILRLNDRVSRVREETSDNSVSEGEQLRRELNNFSETAIDFSRLDEMVERWRQIQLTEEEATALKERITKLQEDEMMAQDDLDATSGMLPLLLVVPIVVVI
jgi:hypothetical protein